MPTNSFSWLHLTDFHYGLKGQDCLWPSGKDAAPRACHAERAVAKRIAVFKRLIHAQMNQLGPILAREVNKIEAPCTTCVSPGLTELMRTLHELPFCQSVTLVMADPQESAALWRDDANVSPDAGPRFERFFIATDVDRAMKLALNGDTAWVDQMNAGPAFNWIQVIRDSQGKPRATLRILGNPTQSYRDGEADERGAS
jgi:hypothetical protein